MRPDMAKILVERPRKGGGCKYPRARVRNLSQNEFVDAPTHEPHKSRHFKRAKWLNENLAPIRRFLRSSLGRPWREVHAEIAAQVPNNNVINYHVWQHLHWDVATDIYMVGGQAYRFGSYGRPWPVRGFYVDPTDGILREARSSKRRFRLEKIVEQSLPERFEVSRALEYHRIDGIWFAIRFSESHEAVWDVLKKAVAFPPPMSSETVHYAAHKRQLGKRELKEEIYPRLRQFLLDRQQAATQLARITKPAPRRAFSFSSGILCKWHPSVFNSKTPLAPPHFCPDRNLPSFSAQKLKDANPSPHLGNVVGILRFSPPKTRFPVLAIHSRYFDRSSSAVIFVSRSLTVRPVITCFSPRRSLAL